MDTLSDILRRTVRDSGLSIRHISNMTDINRLSLTRFLDGYQMTSDNLDALAAFFDLRLAPGRTDTKRGKRK